MLANQTLPWSPCSLKGPLLKTGGFTLWLSVRVGTEVLSWMRMPFCQTEILLSTSLTHIVFQRFFPLLESLAGG